MLTEETVLLVPGVMRWREDCPPKGESTHINRRVGVSILYNLNEKMLAIVPPREVLPMSCSRCPIRAPSSSLQEANFFTALPAIAANNIGNAVTDYQNWQ